MIQRRDKKRTASAKRIQAAFLEENHIDIEEIKNEGKYDLNKLYVDLNAGKGEDKVYYDIKHPSERYIPISTMYWSIFEYKNHSTYYDSFMNLYNILHEYRFGIQFCEGERNEIFSLL